MQLLGRYPDVHASAICSLQLWWKSFGAHLTIQFISSFSHNKIFIVGIDSRVTYGVMRGVTDTLEQSVLCPQSKHKGSRLAMFPSRHYSVKIRF